METPPWELWRKWPPLFQGCKHGSHIIWANVMVVSMLFCSADSPISLSLFVTRWAVWQFSDLTCFYQVRNKWKPCTEIHGKSMSQCSQECYTQILSSRYLKANLYTSYRHSRFVFTYNE